MLVKCESATNLAFCLDVVCCEYCQADNVYWYEPLTWDNLVVDWSISIHSYQSVVFVAIDDYLPCPELLERLIGQ